MRTVTFQTPIKIKIDKHPNPVLKNHNDAIVAIETSEIYGSNLHIYHNQIKMEPNFTIDHEFIKQVLATNDAMTRMAMNDRMYECFHTTYNTCFYCIRNIYQKYNQTHVFDHNEALNALPNTQADQTLVPMANLTLHPVPDGVNDDVTLFADDVMNTAYHAVENSDVHPNDSVTILGLKPVDLCAVQLTIATNASPILTIDTIETQLEIAHNFKTVPIHLTESKPRDMARSLTERHSVAAAIDTINHPDALDLAIHLTRNASTVVAIGVYAEPCQVHMNVVWIKDLTLRTDQTNIISHVDRILNMLAANTLDPTPLVTHHIPLDDAPKNYTIYDRHKTLKIVLHP